MLGNEGKAIMAAQSDARAQIAEYRQGRRSLKSLAWSLEDLVIGLEERGWEKVDELREIWFDVEIVNALNQDSGREVNVEEVSSLLGEYLACLR
ncbi:hypothetical protein WKY82_08420 [Gordonia malaquae]|uniref:hypothetical protein n=1 Tax=Gordonia malaquae TaxID=410332 RepID=UPI0030C79D8E